MYCGAACICVEVLCYRPVTTLPCGPVRSQARQLGEMWASELEQKMTEQEGHYQEELLRALVRLRGIEAMVDTVADAGTHTESYSTVKLATTVFLFHTHTHTHTHMHTHTHSLVLF